MVKMSLMICPCSFCHVICIAVCPSQRGLRMLQMSTQLIPLQIFSLSNCFCSFVPWFLGYFPSKSIIVPPFLSFYEDMTMIIVTQKKGKRNTFTLYFTIVLLQTGLVPNEFMPCFYCNTEFLLEFTFYCNTEFFSCFFRKVVLYSQMLMHAGVSEWQTRQTQNLLYASTCGFESHHRHEVSIIRIGSSQRRTDSDVFVFSAR